MTVLDSAGPRTRLQSRAASAARCREEVVVVNIREEFARMWIAERTKLRGRRRR